MIASKFGIGQQVRHSLLGYLGVVVDIDPVYSLSEPSPDELAEPFVCSVPPMSCI